MYKQEELSKYKYFTDQDISIVLDSLTGIVARQFILEYAKTLISKNVPFAMCMIDLDNFKQINDNFGHNAGDICLKEIAEGLQKFIGEDGLVGRFGGDEFIIIYLKNNTYDEVHNFLQSMYDDKDGPLRRTMKFGGDNVFVTATIGCSSFPLDSKNYDELFLKMDKALYR